MGSSWLSILFSSLRFPRTKLSLRDLLLAVVKRILPLIPPFWRLWVYKHRAKKAPYGSLDYAGCLKIFPSIWVKSHKRAHLEAESICLVRRHTSVPVPDVIDLVEDPTEGSWYMLMSELPGKKFSAVRDEVSTEEISYMGCQLRDWLQQLRAIPSPYGSSVCGVNHTGIVSYRWSERPQGPFASISELHRWMFRSFNSEELEEPEIRQAVSTLESESKPRALCFTHGDLFGWNVLAEDGKLTGIVDWECAAWLPDYWEYSAPHYPRGFVPENKWQHVVCAAMDNYDSEVNAEMQVWKRRSFCLGF
ncbi:kinase-like protein [Obba rivulosa]|uniref:Kinase-like protein n=1 Tax=Obba rivulosa TaxID=1052685 RepID=A0A8E2AUW1_9APHY|nr:kinase-like protein [Obba rivulosa]